MMKSNKLAYNTPNLNPPNPPSKFKTENWVEINDECTTLVVKLNSKLQY